MHCLNLKVVTDFNARSWPSRLVVDSYAAGTRGQMLNCNSNYKHQNVRLVKIVACSTSEDPNPISGSCQGQNSVLSRTQTYALLKQQLEVAAKSEDYKEAARLRDSLKIFEEEEPVLRLKRSLKEAITEEKFEDAARYRDELKEIAPHSLLKCSSDATTLGVRVQVRSVYIESRSQPSKGLYFFAYRIRITNNSDRPVQLLRRHWIITDANGKTENVWGIGVIGEQPVILPNTGFEYSSACPLSTPSGRMEGDFEMKHIDKVGSRTFNVAIAPFSLSTFGDGTDAF
ncbi:uncharacterized protein LOC111378967 [Olea europaea var. sylvestris]|uniref:SKP1 ASK-interacting 16 isoform 1 n=1 Tax=Olea europaea subsp. europaea TaxID=158383 RepID=A0A8S0Q0P5_OLEEU|nr:uncharacterized protein LOC111378967 [Olea europaea var. sylvestris]CAA2960445.1 SKP1 ASK-interacting 16 isoform 1 [Olea europaea subsp. europaea]